MKTIVAKFPGKCDLCGGSFPKGETIAYNGRCHHVACVERDAAEEKAREEENWAKQLEWRAARQAGEHIKTTVRGDELIVTGAWDYAQAKAEAFAFISSLTAATGVPALLRYKKNAKGKRVFGRELGFFPQGSNLWCHEGYAFRFVTPAVAA